jgi:hypothetical protein
MKTCLALLLILLPIATSYAVDNPPSSENHGKTPAAKSAKALADQVSAIVNSSTLTLKEKDDQVSAAVQDAVSDAIANLTDPAEILKATEELTTAAAESAPQFTHAILAGIATIPAVTAISGAIDQVKAAVVDTATKAAAAAFDSDSSKHDGDKDQHQEDHDHDHDDRVVSPST